MSEFEIEHIWMEQKSSDVEEHELSFEEIRAFRINYPRKFKFSRHILLVLDSILKSLVVIATWILLLFVGEITQLKLSLSLLITVGFLLLIFRNHKLASISNSIDVSENLITVLKAQYRFLYRFYNEFILSNAITNPFLVLAGFQFYHYFKYGEDGLIRLLTDPVIYIFLILSFLIPFISQKITYKAELKELEKMIKVGIDDTSQSTELIGIYESRRKRFILFALLTLAGILILLIAFFYAT